MTFKCKECGNTSYRTMDTDAYGNVWTQCSRPACNALTNHGPDAAVRKLNEREPVEETDAGG